MSTMNASWARPVGRGVEAKAGEPPFAKRRPFSDAADVSADDREMRRRRLAALARLMDNAFEVPGLGVRFGVDGLIGLVPGAGDAISAAISAYIVYEGWKLGATRGQLARMIGNIAIDTAVGAIPLLGDLADIAFKANVRNLRILGIDAGVKK